MQIAKCKLTRALCIFQFAFCNLQFLLAASAAAQVQLPPLNTAEPVRITAQAGNHWQAGSFEVWILRGNCAIQQGKATASGGEAVLWIDHAPAVEQRQSRVIAYLEGNVTVALDARPGAPRLTDRTWLGRFLSSAAVDVRAAAVAGKPDVLPAVYWRAMEARSAEVGDASESQVRQVRYTTPPPAAGTTPPGGLANFPASRPGRGPPWLCRLPEPGVFACRPAATCRCNSADGVSPTLPATNRSP